MAKAVAKSAAKSAAKLAAKSAAKKAPATAAAKSKHKAASTFVWYDVMTTDMKAAAAFYKSVVGWTAKDSGQTDRKYVLFSAGDRMTGGLMPIPVDARKMGIGPAWMGYIGVADIDAYCAQVRAAGGHIHRGPEGIPNVGRMAVAADPHGAGFVLFEPIGADPNPPVAGGTHGHIGWHELYAGDREAAFKFYSKLFGWTKSRAIDMGPMGLYQLFAVNGVDIGGMMTKPAEVKFPHWLYYINVDAIDAALARVAKAKGRLLMGPTQVPGGSWIAQCTDPQGAVFALVSAKR